MYGKALREVVEVLENMPDSDTSKISPEFMKMIIENSDWSYEFVYDKLKSLEDQNISEEARCVLAIIYLRYFAEEDEKKELISQMRQNDLDSENMKKELYNPDNLFENKHKETIEDLENEVSLIKMPEKWYKRIFNKIKDFFKR